MRRILFAPGVDRDALDRAAAEHGWPLLNIFARRDGRPRQVIFGTAEWLLTYVEDHRIDARYVTLAGHDTDALAAQVRSSLPVLGRSDVLAMLASDRVRAICWLGVVGPPEADELVATILDEADASVDERERDAARFAREALGWADG